MLSSDAKSKFVDDQDFQYQSLGKHRAAGIWYNWSGANLLIGSARIVYSHRIAFEETKLALQTKQTKYLHYTKHLGRSGAVLLQQMMARSAEKIFIFYTVKSRFYCIFRP